MQAIKKKMELSIAAPLIDIYSQKASPFSVLCCQSVASQDGTRNRNRNMFTNLRSGMVGIRGSIVQL